ncbi:hypothetical protein E3E28_04115 [Thermococcus sp. 21S9]|nr:hypothetical protein [Thermococcus sp. 21S9]
METKLVAKAVQKRRTSPKPKATTEHGKRKGRGEFKVFGKEKVKVKMIELCMVREWKLLKPSMRTAS